jgi:hypothetical protein
MRGLRIILEKKLIQKIPVSANRGKRIFPFPLKDDDFKMSPYVDISKYNATTFTSLPDTASGRVCL